MMNDKNKKKVLITGASKGIGKEIALILISAGYDVIGTSRNPESIPIENKIPGMDYHTLDLTKNESINQLIHKVGEIDILINNAGTSQMGPIEEVPIEKIRELFELNLFGLIQLTQGLLPMMRERKSGLIINISSMAGRSPVPFTTFYAVTKASVEAFSKGLQNEVEKYGIKTCVIAPFGIKTKLPQEVIVSKNSVYKNLVFKAKKIRDRNLAEAPDSEIIGKLVLKIINSKKIKFYYPVGKNAKLKGFLIKHAPRSFIKNQILKMYLGE